jgi:hypothetical protein
VRVNDGVAAVRAAIAAAFADTPRVPRAAMVYRGSWETQNLIHNLARVDDVPTSRFIEWHADSLPEFTPAGLRHVLPFYLTYSLENPQSDVTEFVIFHLSPADTTDDYWQERVAVFSATQKHAICEYVRLMRTLLASDHYDEYLARAAAVWGCE